MKPDGGPAFPVQVDEATMAQGLSVRDAFAIAALQGILAAWPVGRGGGALKFDAAAEGAYQYADAMLAERARE